jgi:hypothetical protein
MKNEKAEFKTEAISPQERATWRKRFTYRSSAALGAIREEIDSFIATKVATEENEIACNHFDPALIAQVHRIRERSPSHKSQLQTIYCTSKKCPLCPHGPFWYSYRSRNRGNSISVRYEGKPAFSIEALDRMAQDVKPPIASYDLFLEDA